MARAKAQEEYRSDSAVHEDTGVSQSEYRRMNQEYNAASFARDAETGRLGVDDKKDFAKAAEWMCPDDAGRDRMLGLMEKDSLSDVERREVKSLIGSMQGEASDVFRSLEHSGTDTLRAQEALDHAVKGVWEDKLGLGEHRRKLLEGGPDHAVEARDDSVALEHRRALETEFQGNGSNRELLKFESDGALQQYIDQRMETFKTLYPQAAGAQLIAGMESSSDKLLDSVLAPLPDRSVEHSSNGSSDYGTGHAVDHVLEGQVEDAEGRKFKEAVVYQYVSKEYADPEGRGPLDYMDTGFHIDFDKGESSTLGGGMYRNALDYYLHREGGTGWELGRGDDAQQMREVVENMNGVEALMSNFNSEMPWTSNKHEVRGEGYEPSIRFESFSIKGIPGEDRSLESVDSLREDVERWGDMNRDGEWLGNRHRGEILDREKYCNDNPQWSQYDIHKTIGMEGYAEFQQMMSSSIQDGVDSTLSQMDRVEALAAEGLATNDDWGRLSEEMVKLDYKITLQQHAAHKMEQRFEYVHERALVENVRLAAEDERLEHEYQLRVAERERIVDERSHSVIGRFQNWLDRD